MKGCWCDGSKRMFDDEQSALLGLVVSLKSYDGMVKLFRREWQEHSKCRNHCIEEQTECLDAAEPRQYLEV